MARRSSESGKRFIHPSDKARLEDHASPGRVARIFEALTSRRSSARRGRVIELPTIGDKVKLQVHTGYNLETGEARSQLVIGTVTKYYDQRTIRIQPKEGPAVKVNLNHVIPNGFRLERIELNTPSKSKPSTKTKPTLEHLPPTGKK